MIVNEGELATICSDAIAQIYPHGSRENTLNTHAFVQAIDAHITSLQSSGKSGLVTVNYATAFDGLNVEHQRQLMDVFLTNPYLREQMPDAKNCVSSCFLSPQNREQAIKQYAQAKHASLMTHGLSVNLAIIVPTWFGAALALTLACEALIVGKIPLFLDIPAPIAAGIRNGFAIHTFVSGTILCAKKVILEPIRQRVLLKSRDIKSHLKSEKRLRVQARELFGRLLTDPTVLGQAVANRPAVDARTGRIPDKPLG